MATPMATPGMTPGGSVGGSGMFGGGAQRLPPEVNRILYVRNLPFNITPEEMYKIFGDYGAIRQIRMCALSFKARGCEKKTKGTAYVVFEDIFDAKRAQEGLSGFNVQNRYLIVLYWNQKRQQQHQSMKEEEERLRKIQEKHGVDGEQHGKPKQ